MCVVLSYDVSVSLRSVVVGPNFLFDDVIGMCVVLNYGVLCLIEVGGGRIHLYLMMSLVCV